MAYGIDNIVQQKADAYRSNPNALMQSYEQKKELIDLLALQKIKSEQEAYARDMQAQMQEVPGTIAQQLEQEVVGTERERITQQIMPGMQQQAQMQPNQMQQAMPGMQQGGLPTQPAPNMARMMQGGIVGYAAGGMLPKAQMPTLGAQQAAPVTPEQVAAFRARLKELNEAKANAFPQEKAIFQQQIQDLLNTTPIAIRNAAGAGMARGGVIEYAEGGDVEKALYDEMGKQYLPGQPIPDDWQTLSNRDSMGPLDPAGGEFADELGRMERTRRERSTRTIPEFLSDLSGSQLTESKAGEILRSPIPAILKGQVERGIISEQEAANEIQKILSGPKGMGQRRQWNKENPDFLSQLKAMKESRERVLDTQEEGMARGGVVGYAPGGEVNPEMETLLDALMMAESGGDANAVSRAGAEGAYQIMPSTAADPGFGVAPMVGDRFDPEASRAFARQYLQAMIDRYDGDVEAGLIAYNAGATNADRFIAAGRDYEVLPQTMQTQPYVNRIMNQVGVSGSSPQNIPEGAGQGVEENNRAANYIAMMQQNEDMLANIATPMPPEVVMEDAVVEDVVVAPRNGIEGYLMNIGRQQQQRRDDFREAVPGAEAAVARAEQEKADGGIGYLRRVGRLQEGAAQRQAEESNRAAKFMAMLQQNQDAIAGMDPAEKGTGQAYTQQTLPFREFQGGGDVKRFAGEDGSLVNNELNAPFTVATAGTGAAPRTIEPQASPTTAQKLAEAKAKWAELDNLKTTRIKSSTRDSGADIGFLGARPPSERNPNYDPALLAEIDARLKAQSQLIQDLEREGLQERPEFDAAGTQQLLDALGSNLTQPETEEEVIEVPLTPKQEQENIVKGLLALPRKSALQKRKEAYEEEFGGSERNGIARLSDFLMGVGQSGGTNLGAALTGGGTALRSGDQAERSRRQEVSKELLGMEELQAARSADLQQIFAESALASQLAAASDRSEFIADAMEEIRSSDPAYGLLEADLLEKLQDGEITQLEYDAGVEFALTSALSRLDSVYSGSVSGTATTPFNAATTGSFDQ
tara:strand:- start:1908 stop:5018 length:3111 start_codon:yes stop_codon:yes gene_type:complete